jgi:hypothetical protein
MAAKVVSNMCSALGYTPKEMLIVDGLLNDGLYPILECNKDVFMKPGVQPSGKYATAEDNCIKNVILAMYAYYASGHDIGTFFINVLIAAYGDDILMAVKAMCPTFNAVVYAKLCKELYGLKFTTASKGDIVSNYISIDDASFLKRTFVYHSVLDRIVCPLDPLSVFKMVAWALPSSSISDHEQIVDKCVSALSEIYFHSPGIDNFNRIRDALADMLVDYYSITDVKERHFPTYSELTTRYDVTSSSCQIEDCSNDESRPHAAIKSEVVYIFEAADNFTREDCTTLPFHNSCTEQLIKVQLEICKNKISTLSSIYGGSLDEYSSKFRKDPSLSEWFKLKCEERGLNLALNSISKKRKKVYVIESLPDLMNDGEVTDQSFSIMENLADDDANEPDHEGDITSSYLDVGLDELGSLSSFLERAVDIGTFNLPIGSQVDLDFPVWDLWSIDPLVRSKLRNYGYIRCDLEIKIYVVGTRFHYGHLMASYQPYPLKNRILDSYATFAITNPERREGFLNYLSQSPQFGIIDVRKNTPYS